MTSPINLGLMRVVRRAEGADASLLARTFVDVGPLITLLRGQDHQVVYGRRGTGKTHALKFLAQEVAGSGDVVSYVDLRTIGSNGSLYADPRLTVAERATKLLVDLLAQLQDQFVDATLKLADKEAFDFTGSMVALDRLAESITTVEVEGTLTLEQHDQAGFDRSRTSSVTGTLGERPSVGASATSSSEAHATHGTRTAVEGVPSLHINVGSVQTNLKSFVDSLDGRRVWCLLDEWSQIPLELQVVLADLVRRCLLPVTGLTVKIAAIEQLSRFRAVAPDGSSVGLQIGADVAADVDLDQFMVFANNPDAAKRFFKELLYRHVAAGWTSEAEHAPADADEFLRRGFTQGPAFDELVRAAEGVPRDAINVANLAAQSSLDEAISVPAIRRAARTWYQRDKESDLVAHSEARVLLHRIHDEVIGRRRARAFFLDQRDAANSLIVALYNARVLHVIRRGYASYVEPGIRFDVYAIDYGAYVHLHSTGQATLGLFEVETDAGDGYVEVPLDDYRSIRRAILRLGDHDATPSEARASSDPSNLKLFAGE